MKKLFTLGLLFSTLMFRLAAQNPIAYFPFTSNATDASGNGYNGTLYGNATANDTLVLGDNATDYVSLPPSLLTGLNDFTISFIVKFTTIHTIGGYPANTLMHAWGSNNEDELKLSYNYGSLVFQVAVKTNQVTFPFNANANRWYCFNVVRSNNQILVYIDGAQVGFAQSSATGSLSPASSGFVLGQEEDCMGGCFASNQSLAGKLDELKFYNYAFTSQQAIAACFSCGDKLFYPFTFGISDSSGNNLNGFLYGNATVTNGILTTGDNATDYASVPDASLMSLADFDVSFAVKFDTLHVDGSFPANTILHAWGVSNQDELKISMNQSLHYFQVNVQETQPVFDFFPVAHEWYCFHVQRISDSIHVYLNGVLQEVAWVPSGTLQIAQLGIVLGQEEDCQGGCFVANQSLAGSLDNFKISNCALLVPKNENCGFENGISEVNANSFSIFPNPADNSVSIYFSSARMTTVRLINELGLSVLGTLHTTSSSIMLPTKSLSSGMYLVEVQCGNQKPIAEKLLIAH